VQEKIPALSNVLGWLEVDLDARLYFAKSLLLVCEDSFFALEPAHETQWSLREWPLTPDLQMRLKDYAGVATLELHTPTDSLGSWRFTLGRNEQAQAFIEVFTALISNSPQPIEAANVQGHIESPTEEHPTPLQGNWGLFRLWRFAKPYQGQLFLGFMLTLASTVSLPAPAASTTSAPEPEMR
jgi:ATP-binding cassette subfamily B protein